MVSSLEANALLRWRRHQLQSGGQASALDWLLDMAGGLSWQALQQLQLNPDRQVVLEQPLETLAAIWQRHLSSGEPLQHLVGRCPWRDLELEVCASALIPRQETELMVDLAQMLMAGPEGREPSIRWADLGTGSGCLAVALARSWPHGEGWAVDCSPQALEIAARNLQRHGVQQRVQLSRGHWWEALQQVLGTLQLVVSNPPYIPTAVWQHLETGVRDFEPALALDGGADGLDAIRSITQGAAEALAPGGVLLLEHHHDQSKAVQQLLATAGLEQITAHRDLEGVHRFASARRPWLP